MDKLKLEVLDALKTGPTPWRTLSKGRSAGFLRAFRSLVRAGYIVESVSDEGPVYSRTGMPVPVEPEVAEASREGKPLEPGEGKPVDLGDLADILADFRRESTEVS
jgi:hypothetical protein